MTDQFRALAERLIYEQLLDYLAMDVHQATFAAMKIPRVIVLLKMNSAPRAGEDDDM